MNAYPTPWKFNPNNGHIVDRNGNSVLTALEDDAAGLRAQVVLAVNCHDALVAALRILAERVLDDGDNVPYDTAHDALRLVGSVGVATADSAPATADSETVGGVRKLYRTTFSIDVLSEESLGDCLSLAQIDYAISEGDCCGGNLRSVETPITPKQAADSLYEFGSTPDFFQLDDDGNTIES